MKYIFILILAAQIVLAQSANGVSSNGEIYTNNIGTVKVIHTENSVISIKNDFNKDGNYDVLKGDNIIKMGSNEYWVRNTTLTAYSGNIITFGNELKINENKIMDQVSATNGYIIVFEEGTGNIDVYIANEFGSKDSDVISISYR